MAGEQPEPVGAIGDDGKWTKSSRLWIPELDTVAQDEIERVKRTTDLERRAAEDGRKNRPPHDDARLNEIQLNICSQIYSGILMLNQFLDEQVDMALKHIRARMPERLDGHRFKDECEREIDRVFGDRHDELVELKTEELAAGRYLRWFRREHRRNEEAHFPATPIKLIALLLLMFLVESLVNGSLFAAISTTGLMGGAMFAGMISAINIGLGLVAGFFGWRFTSHVKSLQKSIGVLVTLICHSAAITWNLLVAHFREAAEIMAARDDIAFDINQMRDATFTHIQNFGIFGIDSLQSWALLLIGLLIHFISAREGWDEISDRYPDYKRAQLNADNTKYAFADAMAELRDDVRDSVEQIEDRAKSNVERARQAERDAAMLLDQAHQRQAEVRDSEDEWVNGGDRLLRIYREINIEIRDKGTTPAYFSRFPSANDYRHNNFDGAIKKQDVEERARSVQKSLAEIERLKTEAGSIADAGDGVVRAIGHHITLAMKEMDEKIRRTTLDITEEAERRLAQTTPTSDEDRTRPPAEAA